MPLEESTPFSAEDSGHYSAQAGCLCHNRMNSVAFIFISVFTLAAALAAATLRNLMHAALCLPLALVGLASFFFLLGAEFVGLALVFIYVGAVAVLIVFTILLTRRGVGERSWFSLDGCFHRLVCVCGVDVVDSTDAIAFDCSAAHSRAHSQKNRRNVNDQLCVAIAMRRVAADRRTHRRARACHGGEAERKDEANAQRPTLNTQRSIRKEPKVGRWALDSLPRSSFTGLGVGRFLPELL